MTIDLANRLFDGIARGDYAAVENTWADDVLVWHTGDPKDNPRARALKVIRWFIDTTTTRSYEILDRQFFDGGFVQQHILRARRSDHGGERSDGRDEGGERSDGRDEGGERSDGRDDGGERSDGRDDGGERSDGEDDVSIEMRVCIVIKVNADGLINRIDEYFDPAEMAPLLS